MIVIHRSLWARECAERSLVLHAMGIEHLLERGVFGWRLVVPADQEARAHEQLSLYEVENRVVRPATRYAAPRPGAVAGALVWAGVLIATYWLQVRYQFGIDWLTTGRLDVAAVRAGEWWRAVTALTLHTDIAHLLVNIGFGAVFGSLLVRQIGPGLAWLMILIGGTLGNLINAMVQRPWHQAIGASTAVFAALGLLAAYLWTSRRLIRNSWARRLAPVVGACILLAWLGTGDERTDIVAHLTGFLAGFGIGAVLGRTVELSEPDPVRQALLGALGLFCVMLAWFFAL